MYVNFFFFLGKKIMYIYYIFIKEKQINFKRNFPKYCIYVISLKQRHTFSDVNAY